MHTCKYCGDEFMNSDEFMAHTQVHALIELSRRIQDTVGGILAQRPHYSQEVLAIARLWMEPNMDIDKAIALCDGVKERLNRQATRRKAMSTQIYGWGAGSFLSTKPETKLMSRLFGEDFDDDDLYEQVDSVPLVKAIWAAIENLFSNQKYRAKYRASARYKRVIILRFGFENTSPQTLAQIGGEMKVSGERIRQMEEYVLRELRRKSGRYLNAFIKNFIKKRIGINS